MRERPPNSFHSMVDELLEKWLSWGGLSTLGVDRAIEVVQGSADAACEGGVLPVLLDVTDGLEHLVELLGSRSGTSGIIGEGSYAHSV